MHQTNSLVIHGLSERTPLIALAARWIYTSRCSRHHGIVHGLWLLVLSCAWLYVPVCSAQLEPQDVALEAKAQQHFRHALELQNGGDLNGAIKEYREGLRFDPNMPSAHNNLGNALDAEGHQDEAIAEYRRAIDLQLNYAIAHKNLANALERKGDRQGAAQQNQLACAFDPDTFCPSPQQTCQKVEIRVGGVTTTTACVPLQVWDYCVRQAKGVEVDCVEGWISNPNGLDPTSVYQFNPPH